MIANTAGWFWPGNVVSPILAVERINAHFTIGNIDTGHLNTITTLFRYPKYLEVNVN